MYTVKQLSDIAGISVRTLHHYDDIALLAPTRIGANGYRYYDESALLRLQQILFYREIGLELAHIRDILNSPDFDLVSALQSHRHALAEKADRLQQLIATIDQTIAHVQGESAMSERKMFAAFSEEQQKDYEREARLQWDADTVNDSVARWASYSPAQKEAIMAQGNQIYTDIITHMESGAPATGDESQALLARWHDHLRHFYEPSLDVLRGLGEMYHLDPAFRATFDAFHPDLSAYMREGIAHYVDTLEHAAIVRLLQNDDKSKR